MSEQTETKAINLSDTDFVLIFSEEGMEVISPYSNGTGIAPWHCVVGVCLAAIAAEDPETLEKIMQQTIPLLRPEVGEVIKEIWTS